jgi:hypothetical protein
MIKRAAAPDSTAVRVALWRAMHVQVDPPPHVLDDEIGLKLAAPEEGWRRHLRGFLTVAPPAEGRGAAMPHVALAKRKQIGALVGREPSEQRRAYLPRCCAAG